MKPFSKVSDFTAMIAYRPLGEGDRQKRIKKLHFQRKRISVDEVKEATVFYSRNNNLLHIVDGLFADHDNNKLLSKFHQAATGCTLK